MHHSYHSVMGERGGVIGQNTFIFIFGGAYFLGGGGTNGTLRYLISSISMQQSKS